MACGGNAIPTSAARPAGSLALIASFGVMIMADTELTVDDLLICLTEECAEVIHAATKCLRFGFHRVHLPYGVNDEVLAQEVGDLLAIIEALPLDTGIINAYKKLKIAKMQQAKQDFGR